MKTSEHRPEPTEGVGVAGGGTRRGADRPARRPAGDRSGGAGRRTAGGGGRAATVPTASGRAARGSGGAGLGRGGARAVGAGGWSRRPAGEHPVGVPGVLGRPLNGTGSGVAVEARAGPLRGRRARTDTRAWPARS